MKKMNKAKAVDEFQRLYKNLYLCCADYCAAQFAWSEYTDHLCKSGLITQKQYDRWAAPFPEGKQLRPTRKMLESEACKT